LKTQSPFKVLPDAMICLELQNSTGKKNMKHLFTATVDSCYNKVAGTRQITLQKPGLCYERSEKTGKNHKN
jgi:hypothetical protein